MKRERVVMASSVRATYRAGRFTTDTDAEAIAAARDAYANSAVGRQLRDVGAFRFYVAAAPVDGEGEE